MVYIGILRQEPWRLCFGNLHCFFLLFVVVSIYLPPSAGPSHHFIPGKCLVIYVFFAGICLVVYSFFPWPLPVILYCPCPSACRFTNVSASPLWCPLYWYLFYWWFLISIGGLCFRRWSLLSFSHVVVVCLSLIVVELSLLLPSLLVSFSSSLALVLTIDFSNVFAFPFYDMMQSYFIPMLLTPFNDLTSFLCPLIHLTIHLLSSPFPSIVFVSTFSSSPHLFIYQSPFFYIHRPCLHILQFYPSIHRCSVLQSIAVLSFNPSLFLLYQSIAVSSLSIVLVSIFHRCSVFQFIAVFSLYQSIVVSLSIHRCFFSIHRPCFHIPQFRPSVHRCMSPSHVGWAHPI